MCLLWVLRLQVQEELKGHQITVVPKIVGEMNDVLIDLSTGLMHGGAYWRVDGAPMGVSDGWARPKGFAEVPVV